jgi:phosphohistidine phosphatase
MDRLILMRHGKAEHNAPTGEDFDRRLTPRGERESRHMAETLADMGFVPDLALVSGAARTRGTWAAVQGVFPACTPVFDDALYLAESGVIRDLALKAGGAARSLLVLGHNPGLQDLTVQMLLEGQPDPSLVARARSRFPTATAAVFLFDAGGRPYFDGLFYPARDHG